MTSMMESYAFFCAAGRWKHPLCCFRTLCIYNAHSISIYLHANMQCGDLLCLSVLCIYGSFMSQNFTIVFSSQSRTYRMVYFFVSPWVNKKVSRKYRWQKSVSIYRLSPLKELWFVVTLLSWQQPHKGQTISQSKHNGGQMWVHREEMYSPCADWQR